MLRKVDKSIPECDSLGFKTVSLGMSLCLPFVSKHVLPVPGTVAFKATTCLDKSTLLKKENSLDVNHLFGSVLSLGSSQSDQTHRFQSPKMVRFFETGPLLNPP